MLDKNNILITGVAGFIGSNLAEELLKSHNVIGIDNFDDFYTRDIKEKNLIELMTSENFTFYETDILNQEQIFNIFKNKGIDTIIHLAAKAGVRPSISDPVFYFKTNIDGTLNLLNQAKENNIKNFIFASSSSVYGNNQKFPFSENDNVDNPISPYAASKKAGELICYTYHHLYNINIACLRFFTVYGRRQRPDLAIAKFTNKIINNQPIEVYGDGSFRRDYTYIDDILDGVIKCQSWLKKQDKPVYEIFNLGESQTYTVLELINEIEEALCKKATIEYRAEQAGDVKITYADIRKAKKYLGYKPTTNLENGIKEYIKSLNSIAK